MTMNDMVDWIIREEIEKHVDSILDCYEEHPDYYPFPERQYISDIKIAERIVDDSGFLIALQDYVHKKVDKKFKRILSERVEARIEEREDKRHKKINMPQFKPNK